MPSGNGGSAAGAQHIAVQHELAWVRVQPLRWGSSSVSMRLQDRMRAKQPPGAAIHMEQELLQEPVGAQDHRTVLHKRPIRELAQSKGGDTRLCALHDIPGTWSLS